MKTHCRLILVSVLLLGLSAHAAPTNNAERVSLFHAADLATFNGNPDVLVLPGLVADRKARRIEFYAEATGLGANEIIEFLLIGPGSGHDYESFAVSHARASDIHQALTFIGMPQGRGVNPSALAFWPKGERVIVSVMQVDTTTNSVWQQAVRLESVVWNKPKSAPMDRSGFVFTGSKWIEPPGVETQKVYAADLQEPRSILSNYNEAQTVLDVPWQASKDSVYSSQQMRGSHALPKAALLKFSLVPERTDGSTRVRDLTLRIAPRVPDARELAEADFSLLNDAQALLMGPTNLPAVVKHIADMVASQHDPFVTLQFTDDAPLGMVKSVSALLGNLEGDKGIRIEPALSGQLYYRAFNPPEQNRARETRMSQPWELHLAKGSNEWDATLIDVKAIYRDGAAEPEFELSEYGVASSRAVREQLDVALRAELGASVARILDPKVREVLNVRLEAFSAEDLWGQRGEGFFTEIQDVLFEEDNYSQLPEKVRRLRVILVYADPGLSHGDLMTFLKDAMTTHPTVHVYLPRAE